MFAQDVYSFILNMNSSFSNFRGNDVMRTYRGGYMAYSEDINNLKNEDVRKMNSEEFQTHVKYLNNETDVMNFIKFFEPDLKKKEIIQTYNPVHGIESIILEKEIPFFEYTELPLYTKKELFSKLRDMYFYSEKNRNCSERMKTYEMFRNTQIKKSNLLPFNHMLNMDSFMMNILNQLDTNVTINHENFFIITKNYIAVFKTEQEDNFYELIYEFPLDEMTEKLVDDSLSEVIRLDFERRIKQMTLVS